MIFTVAKREATALFRTPLAWSLLGLTQFILAYQFLAQIEVYMQFADRLRALPEPPGVTEVVVTQTVGVAALVMLFVVPVITMTALGGERRNGTLALLYSSPITATQIVVGKFLGVFALLSVLWLIVALMPLTLALGTPLDIGIYCGSLLALFLLMATYAAVGLLCSATFSQPAVAAIAAFSVLISLWLIDWAVRAGQETGGLFGYLSSLNHFQRMASGLLSSTDVAYFLIVTMVSLYATIWRLQGDREPI